MPKLFDDILLKGIKAGQVPARTSTARDWYRKQAKSLGQVRETAVMKDQTNKFASQVRVGTMYMFYYDPKWKDELPYYDSFPLVFPIAPTKDGGFLGINLHYLRPKMRAMLMDALYDTVTNQNYDDKTKLKISYKILDSAAKFRYFKPTIKKYLMSHVRSRFLEVHPTEWDMALFLNVEAFQKESKYFVWSESEDIIRGFSNTKRKGSTKSSSGGKTTVGGRTNSKRANGVVKVKPRSKK